MQDPNPRIEGRTHMSQGLTAKIVYKNAMPESGIQELTQRSHNA
jgi:hypothetical protein